MAVTLKQLEAFAAVAELGGFRRAAERLNTTQPNISARIAGLEALLGHRLMERDAGSVRLTPRGIELLDHARGVLTAVDGMVQAAGGGALYDGTLRLGVTEMIAHTWLRPYLRALRDALPNVVVELTVDLSTNLSFALFDRVLDLTFQNGPFSREACVTLPLTEHPWIWVAPADHRFAGHPLSAAHMQEEQILTHARDSWPYSQLDAHFEGRARLVPTSEISVAMQLAIDGLGVACVPSPMAQGGIASGALVALDYKWLPVPLRFAARYEARSAPGYLVQAAKLAQRISEDHKN